MALLDPVRANAISKGVFGNSRFWLVVGGVAWLVRGYSWARRPQEHTIFRQVLESGDSLVISASGPPPSDRDRRRSRKVERSLAKRERREQVATARMRHHHRVLGPRHPHIRHQGGKAPSEPALSGIHCSRLLF